MFEMQGMSRAGGDERGRMGEIDVGVKVKQKQNTHAALYKNRLLVAAI